MGLPEIDLNLGNRSFLDVLQPIIDQLMATGGLGTFGENMDGLLASMTFLSKFIELDMVQAFEKFMEGLSELESVPDFVKEALANFDLSTEEGRIALSEWVREMARQLSEGDLEIGGLTPAEFEDMLDYLKALSEGEGVADDKGITTLAVQRAITDVQANAVIRLLEQQVYWTRTISTDLRSHLIGIIPDEPSIPYEDAPPPEVQSFSNIFNVNLNGDPVLAVPLDPHDPQFAIAAGRALEQHLTRYQGRPSKVLLSQL